MEKEREFDSVQIKSDSFNKVIKFEELKVLPNLNDVKQYLLCPTPGCNAKLIWVNARQPYLKALHNEDHDPKLCSHYREKVLLITDLLNELFKSTCPEMQFCLD